MEITAVADFKVPLFFILPHHLPTFCLFLHFFLDKFKFQSSQGRQMQGTYSFPDRKYDWGNIQLAIQRKHLFVSFPSNASTFVHIKRTNKFQKEGFD